MNGNKTNWRRPQPESSLKDGNVKTLEVNTVFYKESYGQQVILVEVPRDSNLLVYLMKL